MAKRMSVLLAVLLPFSASDVTSQTQQREVSRQEILATIPPEFRPLFGSGLTMVQIPDIRQHHIGTHDVLRAVRDLQGDAA
jgi:hypothetical protein